jgi:serine/threonine-protein kinase
MTSSSDDDDAESAPTSVGLGPGDETTIVPPATQAASQHAWSQEEPETEPLRQSWGLTWGRAAVLLVCTGVIALAVGLGGWALARMHESASAPSPVANSPTSWAAPQPPPWMPATTAQLRTPPTPVKLGIGDLPGTDGLGWTNYPGARCDPGNQPAAIARTTQSVVVVCEIEPGNFYYRGVRLSDGASIELANAVRSSQGFDVANPTDGTTYRIRSTSLTIAPQTDRHLLSR